MHMSYVYILNFLFNSFFWWCLCWVPIQSLCTLANALSVSYIHSIYIFETGSHYIVHASSKLSILLPLLP